MNSELVSGTRTPHQDFNSVIEGRGRAFMFPVPVLVLEHAPDMPHFLSWAIRQEMFEGNQCSCRKTHVCFAPVISDESCQLFHDLHVARTCWGQLNQSSWDRLCLPTGEASFQSPPSLFVARLG